MPRVSGHELLAEIREDADLGPLLVFILTTSDHARDVRQAHKHHVAGYFMKSQVDGLMQAACRFNQPQRDSVRFSAGNRTLSRCGSSLFFDLQLNRYPASDQAVLRRRRVSNGRMMKWDVSNLPQSIAARMRIDCDVLHLGSAKRAD